ncbi:hypothetical protein ABZZ46_31690 [Streptomyces rochei]|uniref:hypothetical protein n=1 Tax=Streptomyces rochei TaxID=1928 RepID=UPI00339E2093
MRRLGCWRERCPRLSCGGCGSSSTSITLSRPRRRWSSGRPAHPGPERRPKGDFLEFFTAAYGPVIVVYRYIGDDTERAAALDAALTDLAGGAHEDAAGPR